MKSPVVKRSIVIAGHKTSVSLEDAFWKGLKDIAGSRDMTLSELVATIDTERRHGNLSSAIRLFVLDHYRNRSARRGTRATGRTTLIANRGAPSALRPTTRRSDVAGFGAQASSAVDHYVVRFRPRGPANVRRPRGRDRAARPKTDVVGGGAGRLAALAAR